MKNRVPLSKLFLSGIHGMGEELLYPLALILVAFLLTAVLFTVFRYVN